MTINVDNSYQKLGLMSDTDSEVATGCINRQTHTQTQTQTHIQSATKNATLEANHSCLNIWWQTY